MTLEPGTIIYRIKSTGKSSSWFGPCDICSQHVSDVFYQHATVAFLDEDDGQIKETYYQAPRSLWGHEACLLSTRKTTV